LLAEVAQFGALQQALAIKWQLQLKKPAFTLVILSWLMAHAKNRFRCTSKPVQLISSGVNLKSKSVKISAMNDILTGATLAGSHGSWNA